MPKLHLDDSLQHLLFINHSNKMLLYNLPCLVNIEITGYFRLHQILDSELYVLHVNTDLILYEDTISFYFMIRISA